MNGSTFKPRQVFSARAALAALALLAQSVLCLPAAQAQAYPTRPVKIIVPFAAGGPADNYARFMAQRLHDALGQPFVDYYRTIKQAEHQRMAQAEDVQEFHRREYFGRI